MLKNFLRKRNRLYKDRKKFKLLYGIGLTHTQQILRKVGLPIKARFNYVSNASNFHFLKGPYLVGRKRKIRRLLLGNYTQFFSVVSENLDYYKGFRHRKNLSVRGQRTHTNAKTQRYLKIWFSIERFFQRENRRKRKKLEM